MRIQLRLSRNHEPVPYRHQDDLIARLRNWADAEHGRMAGLSLYSFSRIKGGVSRNNALDFPSGARWTLSFLDPDLGHAIMRGIHAEPEVVHGMKVETIEDVPEPDFSSEHRFDVASPVLVRWTRENGYRVYGTWKQDESDEALTRTLRKKIAQAGLTDEHLEAEVRFDRSAPNKRLTRVWLRGYACSANCCPVLLSGTPEAKRIAWLTGVGERTGSGFGALR